MGTVEAATLGRGFMPPEDGGVVEVLLVLWGLCLDADGVEAVVVVGLRVEVATVVRRKAALTTGLDGATLAP